MESWISRASLLSDPITRYAVEHYDQTAGAITAEEYEEKYYGDYRRALLRYIDEHEDELVVAKKMGGAYSLSHGFRVEIPAGPYSTKTPATCYENMLSRIMPLSVSGVLWYQGESNTGETPFEHRTYFNALMDMLVREWRRGFDNEDLPFYTVQLAAYTYSESHGAQRNWAEVREAQREFAETHDGVYMVSALDIGEYDQIHPINKKPVGRRLAHALLANHYGVRLPWQSPSLKSVRREGELLILDFEHAKTLSCTSPSPQGFYTFDRDGVEHRVEARIDGARVLIRAAGVAAIAYCYRNYAVADMYNEHGLPMLPFYHPMNA